MHKAVLSLVALALSGCSTIWLPARSIENEKHSAPGIIVHGDSLEGIVRAGPPQAESVWPDQRLKVVVPIRNIDIEPIRVVVEIRFLEAEAGRIAEVRRRVVLSLESMEVRQAELSSSGPGVFGFEVRLMWDK